MKISLTFLPPPLSISRKVCAGLIFSLFFVLSTLSCNDPDPEFIGGGLQGSWHYDDGEGHWLTFNVEGAVIVVENSDNSWWGAPKKITGSAAVSDGTLTIYVKNNGEQDIPSWYTAKIIVKYNLEGVDGSIFHIEQAERIESFRADEYLTRFAGISLIKQM